jgi:hypothetical protein
MIGINCELSLPGFLLLHTLFCCLAFCCWLAFAAAQPFAAA